MLTFFTLLVLGVLLGIVLMQLFKKQTPAAGPVPVFSAPLVLRTDCSMSASLPLICSLT